MIKAALLFLLLVLRRKSRQPGDRARLALILLCAFQLVFESLREDEFLRWGFVRVGQLIPAMILFCLLAYALFIKKTEGWRAPRHLAVTGFLLLAALVTALEFALDKTTLSVYLIYALMLAAVTGMYALARKAAVGG